MIPGDHYGFTAREICDVAVFRIMRPNQSAIFCRCCGMVKLLISCDTGMKMNWMATANVIDRLRRGEWINGRLD